MFKTNNKRKHLLVDSKVLNALVFSNMILSNELLQIKEIEVAAATDRRIVIEQLTKIN
jgi:hypothetical protein